MAFKNIAITNMQKTTRLVYVRGYTKKGVVVDRLNNGYFVVDCDGREEQVPEHHFYHRDPNGFIVLRDSVEFLRKYPNQPIEQEEIKS